MNVSTFSMLFATMVPQTLVSMMSLAPPVMAQDWATELALPPAVAGLYTGLINFFVLITNTLSAPLIDRFGPLRLSFACIVLAGLGLVLFASGTLAGVFVATALIGLSYGPLTPASSQVLANQSRSQAFALLVSIRQTSVPLGGVLAGFLVPQLILRFGWKGSCIALGATGAGLALLAGLALSVIRSEKAAGRARMSSGLLGPLRFIVQRRDLLTLATASMIFGALQLVLSSFLVIYLVSVVGHGLVSAGALLGLSQAAGVLGRIGWGYAADQIKSPRRLLALIGIAMAISCLATALLVHVGPSLLAAPVVILFGATASGWNGVFLAEVMREVEPAEVGLATSGSLIFTYFGVVAGPPLFGAAATFFGFPGAYMAACAVVLGGAFLALPATRVSKADSSGQGPGGPPCR